MPRVPFVAGNWKMHCAPEEARSLARACVAALTRVQKAELAVFPPLTSLVDVAKILQETNVVMGAQTCHFEKQGAFTGEISAQMLKGAGCTYALAGHSERRKLFGETDAIVGQKVAAIVSAGLRAVLCVGETLEERDAGRMQDVVARQTRAGLSGVTADKMTHVTIAYEPVWAIGTGKNATASEAQTAHAWIRGLLVELYGADAAERTRILYGGSVKPENAADLSLMADVDGFLVGGASLNAASFAAIATSCEKQKLG